ncbi:MAG: helix-turn-helix domain-containing protein [Candidatus Brocadiales bacterium]|nr:helix-turn-helix domain-containing protein [Candidatus Brocadiales bacterium]
MERYLSAKEVSRILGFALITLAKWRKKKIGPKFIELDNGRIRYKQSDVEAYMDQFGVRGGKKKNLPHPRLKLKYM